jgi:integrase
MQITEKSIEKLQPRAKRWNVRDTQVTGFGLRIEPSGRKSFFWNAKVCNEIVFRALGEWPSVTVKDARDRAKELAGLAARWKQNGCKEENPFRKEKQAGNATGAPLFSDLVEHYVKNHLHNPAAKINHPDKAEKNLRWTLKRYFGEWMTRPVDSITIGDVVQLRDAAKESPYSANRNVQLVRALFAYCAGGKDGKINVWELSSNVATRVELFPENERERYLTPEEQVLLEKALEDERTPRDLADFVLLSLETGARKMSLLLAEWTEIGWEEREWKIPAGHSKSGKSYVVDLSQRAIEILERRYKERTTSPLLFPPISGEYLHLDKPFTRLIKRIGGTLASDPVHIHDLRRTLGTTMSCNGASLEQIAKALGQESISATSIYARLSRASVREAKEDAQAKRREQMDAAKKRMEAQKQIPVVGRKSA